RVMPFGLRNAPATFQQFINQLFADFDFCCAYLDDIAVFSETWVDHLQHLSAVFQLLASRNVVVNFEKCSFAKPTVKYLGHNIGSGKHAPDPEKLKAIESMKAPT